MRILWIVNTIFPDVATHLNLPVPVYGGWMYGLAADLVSSAAVQLAVATVYDGAVIQSFEINGTLYYLVPKQTRLNSRTCPHGHWRQLVNEFKPDLVHIHGTEYSHGMKLMDACPNLKYLVSIQGLVSVYYRYFFSGMSTLDILRNITFRDILRWNTIFHAREDFFKRGKIEHEYILRATGVIGRTEWDYSHVKAIRQDISYYHCNESLRNEFYTIDKWSIDRCKRHSIFLSQASYPLKGLHQVIKAVALLRFEFPDIVINIAGPNIIKSATVFDRLKHSGYGSYISKLINKLDVLQNVNFLGTLSASEMKKAYLSSHVFICPSSIENSPNSLGEAQILGVPCIATYTGGIPSMVKGNLGIKLYQFDEYEMLASNLKYLFSNDNECISSGNYSNKNAVIRHNRKSNISDLNKIYIKFNNLAGNNS